MDVADWILSTTGGLCALFSVNRLYLGACDPPSGGDGLVTVAGRRQASVATGTLIFKSRASDVYVEPYYPSTGGSVYGNAQPRGLANGSDRNNAIEFVSRGASLVGCRTVLNGTVTETVVDIGQNLRAAHVYQIVAKADEVKFYVSGVLQCTHTTNIPTVPLNILFSTSDPFSRNIAMVIDSVSLERRPPQ